MDYDKLNAAYVDCFETYAKSLDMTIDQLIHIMEFSVVRTTIQKAEEVRREVHWE